MTEKEELKDLIKMTIMFVLCVISLFVSPLIWFPVLGEEIPSEWDAETGIYYNEETGEYEEKINYYNEESRQEVLAPAEDKNTAEALKTLQEEIKEIVSTMGGPVKAPIKTEKYIGLDTTLPIYLYTVEDYYTGDLLYLASNSNAITVGSSNGVIISSIYNLYVDDNGNQQASPLYYTRDQAISPLWGYATINNEGRLAQMYAGAVYADTKTWQQPYKYVFPWLISQSGESDGNVTSATYYYTATVQNNEVTEGTDQVPLRTETFKLIEEILPPEPKELALGDIYFLGGSIISLLIIMIFKRGKRT